MARNRVLVNQQHFYACCQNYFSYRYIICPYSFVIPDLKAHDNWLMIEVSASVWYDDDIPHQAM